jgi:hypothetical protein
VLRRVSFRHQKKGLRDSLAFHFIVHHAVILIGSDDCHDSTVESRGLRSSEGFERNGDISTGTRRATPDSWKKVAIEGRGPVLRAKNL